MGASLCHGQILPDDFERAGNARQHVYLFRFFDCWGHFCDDNDA